MRRRRPSQRVLILFAAMLVFVLICIDFLAGWITIPTHQSLFRCRHPYYHHGFLPNANTKTLWGSRRYRMATNSLGFRDSAPRTVQPDSQDSRIMFMGDSFTEGLGVAFDDTFCGLLSRRFARDGVEVHNAAALSYSPKLYYLKTKFLIEQVRFEFAKLVVMIDVSDIQDETFYESFEPRMTHSLADRVDTLLYRRSFTYNTLSRRLIPLRNISTEFHFSDKAESDVWIESRDIDYFDDAERWLWTVDQKAFGEMSKRGLRIASEWMTRLVDLCRARNVDSLVVVYPGPYQVLGNDRNSIQVRHWRRFCEKHDVPFLDLFPTFIDPKLPGPQTVIDRYFVKGDVHLNETGHRLVADLLYEQLK